MIVEFVVRFDAYCQNSTGTILADGRLIESSSGQTDLDYAEMPQIAKDAIVAAEDRASFNAFVAAS